MYNWNGKGPYSRRSGRITVIWERSYSSVRVTFGLKDCVFSPSEEMKYTTFFWSVWAVYPQKFVKEIDHCGTCTKLKLWQTASQERKQSAAYLHLQLWLWIQGTWWKQCSSHYQYMCQCCVWCTDCWWSWILCTMIL